MTLDSIPRLLDSPGAFGAFMVTMGVLAFLFAPQLARFNRWVLRRSQDYETGYRWTARVGGILFVIYGVAHMAGLV
jgi:threonine/homoserine/homoserine lactone efflux protein